MFCLTDLICWLNLQEEEPDEDETFNLVHSLKKVSIFYACHNMGAWRIFDSLFECIQKAKDGNKIYPDEVITVFYNKLLFYFKEILHIDEIIL